MRPHRHSTKFTSKKDAHSQNNISSKQQYHHHSKSSRNTTSSARKTKKTIKTKGAASSNSPSAGERKEDTNRAPDRRQLNLAITVEKPSTPPAATEESNYFSSKDIVVVVEPHAQQLSTPAPCTLLSANSSPGRQHQASSTMPSQESTSSSRSASSSSLASSSSATASASSSSSFCRHCLRPQRELQLRYVRHRRHKKPEINQELPIKSHNNHHQLGIAQPSVLSEGVHNRRTSKRSMATTSSTVSAMRAGGSQRTAHRSSAGTLTFAPTVGATSAVTRHRQRHMQRFSQPLTTTTIRIESEGGGAASTSRNQNFNQNLSVTTPNLLTVSGASSNRSSRSGPASSSRSGELDQQTPDSPSLVKVRTWYTVAKQGVSC